MRYNWKMLIWDTEHADPIRVHNFDDTHFAEALAELKPGYQIQLYYAEPTTPISYTKSAALTVGSYDNLYQHLYNRVLHEVGKYLTPEQTEEVDKAIQEEVILRDRK